MLSINHNTFVITIPKADTSFVSTNAQTGYEIRSFDEYAFMREFADYLDSEEGQVLPNGFNHNTSVTISGVTYARAFVILAPYTVTFENGAYQVKLVGGMNNNLLDVLNPNQVSVIPANSAGLQAVNTGGGSGASAAEVWSYVNRTLTSGTNAFATPFSYKVVANNQSASDPSPGRIKWNNATQNLATEIYIDVITDDGIDLTNYMKNVASGSVLYIQDRDDSAKFQRWSINLGVDNTGWMTLNVSLIASSGGNLANNAQSVIVYNLPAISETCPTAQENAQAVIDHPETLTTRKYIGYQP